MACVRQPVAGACTRRQHACRAPVAAPTLAPGQESAARSTVRATTAEKARWTIELSAVWQFSCHRDTKRCGLRIGNFPGLAERRAGKSASTADEPAGHAP